MNRMSVVMLFPVWKSENRLNHITIVMLSSKLLNSCSGTLDRLWSGSNQFKRIHWWSWKTFLQSGWVSTPAVRFLLLHWLSRVHWYGFSGLLLAMVQSVGPQEWVKVPLCWDEIFSQIYGYYSPQGLISEFHAPIFNTRSPLEFLNC